MRSTPVLVVLSLVLAAGALTFTYAGPYPEDSAAKANIAGTYRLMSRDLPDGTTLTPPAINGLMTFSDGYRNFNIFWQDAAGNPFSISYIAQYTLSDTEYTETAIYYMVNDGISGAGVSYDHSGKSGSSPVMMSDDELTIDFPLWDEPTVVFAGDQATATREGEFVDHWEKVE